MSNLFGSDTLELHFWGYDDGTAQEYSAVQITLTHELVLLWLYPMACHIASPLETVSIPFHLNAAYSQHII